MKEIYYKIKNGLNWRKEEGTLMVLEPVSKRLLFVNEAISKKVSCDGYVLSHGENEQFFKDLIKQGIVETIKKPDHKLDFLSYKKISAPINVTIQITNRCNLNCIHCHRVKKNTKDLSLGDFKKTIDELRKINVFNVNISGGEPTVHKDLIKMIACISNAGLKATLSTNGFNINEKLVNSLFTAGLKNIQLSLDSAEEEKHNALRGGKNAFKKTVESAKFLKKSGIKYIFVTTLISQTPQEYSEIIDWSFKLGASAHKTNTVVPQGEARSLTITKDIEDYKKIWLKKRRKYKNKMSVIAETMFSIQMGRSIISPLGVPKMLNIGCPAGILTSNINESGEVSPCPFFPDLVFGNILNDNFADCYGRLRKFFKDRQKINVCNKCSDVLVCGGCRARSYGTFNEINKEDPYCFKYAKKNRTI